MRDSIPKRAISKTRLTVSVLFYLFYQLSNNFYKIESYQNFVHKLLKNCSHFFSTDEIIFRIARKIVNVHFSFSMTQNFFQIYLNVQWKLFQWNLFKQIERSFIFFFAFFERLIYFWWTFIFKNSSNRKWNHGTVWKPKKTESPIDKYENE